MKTEFLDKIKSRGYWRVNFQPLVDAQKLTLEECKEIVRKNSVALRGWNYPHFPPRSEEDQGLIPGNNYYEGWVDGGSYKEFWKMYQSEQFIHYKALKEDWFEGDIWFNKMAENIKPGAFLGITGGVVYQITEVFEYLSRLGKAGLYNEGVIVSIGLHNTENRQLWIENGMRAPLYQRYLTGAQIIEFDKAYSKEQVIIASKELALEVIKHIFARFGWHTPPIDTFKKDQDDLLSGRV